MESLEELLQKAQVLYENEQYGDIIELLKDDVVEFHQSADLYAEKALSYFRLGINDLCNESIEKALHLDSENALAYFLHNGIHTSLDEYDKRFIHFLKSININPIDVDEYCELGYIYNQRNEHEKGIKCYQKAIEINQRQVQANTQLLSAAQQQKDYVKAYEYLNKTIDLNHKEANAYTGLAYIYFELRDYNESIRHFEKALQLAPSNSDAKDGLESVLQQKEEENVTDIKFYKDDFEGVPEIAYTYYNQAKDYEHKKEYQKSLENFEKYIELTENDLDYFKEVARDKVIELKKLIEDAAYTEISELVNKIKDLLLFKDNCITHYTGISVAKLLILDGSKLRLSEGAFLNDTSEGRELFKFLPTLGVTNSSTNTSDTVALPFTPKPFIGSFVAETKHDDLTLWRMYGKENKEEAKGCAITLDRNLLLENLKSTLTGDENPDSPKVDDEEFRFYSVAYIQSGQLQPFIIPGATKENQETLNRYMGDLFKKVKKFVANKKKKKTDVPNLLELLNSIAYLFKTAEYHYEHELRLIVKGVGFEKKVDTYFTPPKVYVELVPIPPLIRKITLGPKVDRAEEWASAFYYKLDAEGHHPEIMISHLPFK